MMFLKIVQFLADQVANPSSQDHGKQIQDIPGSHTQSPSDLVKDNLAVGIVGT